MGVSARADVNKNVLGEELELAQAYLAMLVQAIEMYPYRAIPHLVIYCSVIACIQFQSRQLCLLCDGMIEKARRARHSSYQHIELISALI